MRNIIERAFGLLKRRFRILRTPPEYSLDTQADIVYACVVIHNFLIEQRVLEMGMEHLRDDLPEETENLVVKEDMDGQKMAERQAQIAKGMWELYSG